MPPADSKIAVIEALGDGPRNRATWQLACAELDAMSDVEVRAHVGELEHSLELWPVLLRVVPPAWAARLASEATEPRALLCRRLDPTSKLSWRDMVTALAAADGCCVQELDLSYCGVGAEECDELAQRLAATNVTSLLIRRNDVRTGLAALWRSRPGRTVTRIDAESCGLENDDFARIADERISMALASLSLSTNYLNAASVGSLVRIPGFTSLVDLSLAGNKFLADGVSALVGGRQPGHLRSLDLSGCQCGDDGIASLVSSSAVERLTRLAIADCEVGDRGALALAQSAVVSGLASLELHRNHISAAGAYSLLSSRSLRGLSTLSLYQNPVGDDLLAMLDSLPGGLRLRTLVLGSELMAPDVRAAVEAHPALKAVAVDFV
jgi:hypothetical protein